MANTRPKELTETITFRLSPGEKSAAEALAARRAQEAEEQGFPPDPSTGGWLRSLIRREAKAAGIALEAPAPAPAPEPAPSKAPAPKRKARP